MRVGVVEQGVVIAVINEEAEGGLVEVCDQQTYGATMFSCRTGQTQPPSLLRVTRRLQKLGVISCSSTC